MNKGKLSQLPVFSPSSGRTTDGTALTIAVYAMYDNITLYTADEADVFWVRAAMEGKLLDTGSLNCEFAVG